MENDLKHLKILFVCLGNSCRSPMSESILKNMVRKQVNDIQWDIDSAALRSWNVGYPPEDRCIRVLKKYNLTSNHIARKITTEDFNKFDYIFGMDDMNVEELKEIAPPNSKARIELLGSYSDKPADKIILDPYFENGIHGFERCYEQITRSCENFVKLKINEP